MYIIYVTYNMKITVVIVCVILIAVEVQTVITIPKDFDLESLLG